MNPTRRDTLACLAGLAALALSGTARAVAEIGEPAPPLKGTLLTGEPLDLSLMRGKVVLINFYSSYCKYCAYEIGNLETMYEKLRAEGLEIVELGIDDVSDRERVQRMLGIYHLPGAMVDELQENGFGRKHPTPTAYLVDRKGIVRHKQWGAKTADYFHETLLPLLREAQ